MFTGLNGTTSRNFYDYFVPGVRLDIFKMFFPFLVYACGCKWLLNM